MSSIKKYRLNLTVNYPCNEMEETDNKLRTAKELLEAMSFELRKHGKATSLMFIVIPVSQED